MSSILVISLSKITSHSSRILKEAVSLQNAGFLVEVHGICFPGQKETESIQGITIKRHILKTKKLPKSFVFQIIKWFELYFKIKKTSKSFSIVDCHCLYSLVIGWLLVRKTDKKLILNAHELETERNGLKGFRKRFSKFLEKKLIYKCCSVIVVSESIKQWYQKTYPGINVVCVYNAPRYEDVDKSDYFRTKYNIGKNNFVFLYQGGFGKNRGIELLLETFSKLPEKYHVVFMGFGNLTDLIQQYAKKYDNIHYHEAVPQQLLGKYTTSANFGFSVLDVSSLNHKYCMPNKLFEYTLFEVPVIVSNTLDQSKFVLENKIGYVLEDYSVEGLNDLITNIDLTQIDTFKTNMHNIKRTICWENQEKKLISQYR